MRREGQCSCRPTRVAWHSQPNQISQGHLQRSSNNPKHSLTSCFMCFFWVWSGKALRQVRSEGDCSATRCWGPLSNPQDKHVLPLLTLDILRKVLVPSTASCERKHSKRLVLDSSSKLSTGLRTFACAIFELSCFGQCKFEIVLDQSHFSLISQLGQKHPPHQLGSQSSRQCKLCGPLTRTEAHCTLFAL